MVGGDEYSPRVHKGKQHGYPILLFVRDWYLQAQAKLRVIK